MSCSQQIQTVLLLTFLSGPGLSFFWEVFDCWINLLTCYWSTQTFLFLHDSDMVGCLFLRIYPYYPGCPICWHITIYTSIYHLVHFCGISWNVSSFIYNFIYLSLLSFFLVNLANSLSILFIFSKNPTLSFLDLLCFYSLFHLFLLWSLLFPSSLLLSSLRHKSQVIYNRILIFSNYRCLAL